MADIVEGVHPTRMELLSMKKRIKIAEKGHKLLKEKRDALVLEFFESAEAARGIRGEVSDTLEKGLRDLAAAEALSGIATVEDAADAAPPMPKPIISYGNIMGVRVPKIDVEFGRNPNRPSYSLAVTESHIDAAHKEFNEALRKSVVLAEREETLRRLSAEIKKTKRRVNALEYIVLPRLKATQKYIRMRLEEMERENFFRLKMVKKTKQRT
ncbi:V-type ATP synthase subunit D [uncultured archaeon]|nr:V-type ATP synthase subunit D [uncultured archaeon]